MYMGSGGTLPLHPTFGQNPRFSLEPPPETVSEGSVNSLSDFFLRQVLSLSKF